jgi:hypothetical protein
MKDMKDYVLIKLAHELADQEYIQPEHVKNALKWQKTSGGISMITLLRRNISKKKLSLKSSRRKKPSLRPR